MKYLLYQSVIMLIGVILLLYFIDLPYFHPVDTEGEIIWYNVSVVLFLVFISLEGFLANLLYLSQKRLAYGKNEWPPINFSLKWASGLSTSIVFLLYLSAINVFAIQWGIIVLIIVILMLIFLF